MEPEKTKDDSMSKKDWAALLFFSFLTLVGFVTVISTTFEWLDERELSQQRRDQQIQSLQRDVNALCGEAKGVCKSGIIYLDFE